MVKAERPVARSSPPAAPEERPLPCVLGAVRAREESPRQMPKRGGGGAPVPAQRRLPPSLARAPCLTPCLTPCPAPCPAPCQVPAAAVPEAEKLLASMASKTEKLAQLISSGRVSEETTEVRGAPLGTEGCVPACVLLPLHPYGYGWSLWHIW